MNIVEFLDTLSTAEITFFAGVPDSQLSLFCDEIARRYGCFNANHVITHNEGGAVAIASGHHLATGKVSCVYMQNSGLGNVLNPVVSLAHPNVYGIPILFIVGWRGEPGIHDEPQHIYQGEITLQLLKDMEVEYYIIDESTTIEQIRDTLGTFSALFSEGKSAAYVVRKGAFTGNAYQYGNEFSLNREKAIDIILEATKTDPIISTTGKISRELFELREQRMENHQRDFLTVGSMGHCLMIACGISLEKPQQRVWCIDGDGSALMHMGSLGVVGSLSPENLVHIVLNNAAHETVGGMPTVAAKGLDFQGIAVASGYSRSLLVTDEESLKSTLEQVKTLKGPLFIEVLVALGSRSDLGRPTTTTHENKRMFMGFLED